MSRVQVGQKELNAQQQRGIQTPARRARGQTGRSARCRMSPATGSSRRPARGGAVDQEDDQKVRSASYGVATKDVIWNRGAAPLPN